jgi:hypothetical protein
MAFLLGRADFTLVISANHVRVENYRAFPDGFPGAKPDLKAKMSFLRASEEHSNRGNACESVQVAGFLGHMSRSAVFLIHMEGLGPAPCEGRKDVFAWRLY